MFFAFSCSFNVPINIFYEEEVYWDLLCLIRLKYILWKTMAQ